MQHERKVCVAYCVRKTAAFYTPLADALMIQILYASLTDAMPVAASVLHKALLYIEEHLCEKLSPDCIAEAIPCSKSFLRHRFQKKMKLSP